MKRRMSGHRRQHENDEKCKTSLLLLLLSPLKFLFIIRNSIRDVLSSKECDINKFGGRVVISRNKQKKNPIELGLEISKITRELCGFLQWHC